MGLSLLHLFCLSLLISLLYLVTCNIHGPLLTRSTLTILIIRPSPFTPKTLLLRSFHKSMMVLVIFLFMLSLLPMPLLLLVLHLPLLLMIRSSLVISFYLPLILSLMLRLLRLLFTILDTEGSLMQTLIYISKLALLFIFPHP